MTATPESRCLRTMAYNEFRFGRISVLTCLETIGGMMLYPFYEVYFSSLEIPSSLSQSDCRKCFENIYRSLGALFSSGDMLRPNGRYGYKCPRRVNLSCNQRQESSVLTNTRASPALRTNGKPLATTVVADWLFWVRILTISV